jgi:hypothetical protein
MASITLTEEELQQLQHCLNNNLEPPQELETSTAGMIVLDETAGLKQVYRRALVDPVSLLERHYHPEADNGR